MKSISILGSTGSIGTQTLEVVRSLPNYFRVVGLATNKNIGLLEEQINEFRPEKVVVYDKSQAETLRRNVGIEVLEGKKGLLEIATLENSELIVNALVGSIGLEPTIKAIQAKKEVALANKETLVMAGKFVMQEAEENNVRIIPIDSEHSAIFQCLQAGKHKDIKKVVLTCSGGPFRTKQAEDLTTISKMDVLSHPVWQMGPKVTVDSATLMNKGLEIIEAHHLFNLQPAQIEVVVHPECIVHSLVEFVDGSIVAQLSNPNMQLPIQYALSYPDRLENNLVAPLDLTKVKDLSFHTPNVEMFPCLEYAYQALRQDGIAPTVLNAANEVAVKAFLNDQINFPKIPELIREALDQVPQYEQSTSYENLISVDQKVRENVNNLI